MAAAVKGLRVEITVLYVKDCPHWQLAEARVREALHAAGVTDVRVAATRVDTPEEAKRLGFHGSPTILADGRDLFARQPPPAGLSCRLYQTESGVAGAPTVPQLTALLAGQRSERAGQRPTHGPNPSAWKEEERT